MKLFPISLENIRFELRPQQHYISEITKHMVATSEDRSRSGTENAIWKEGFEEYFFIVAIDNISDEAIGALTLSMERSIHGEPLWMIGSLYVWEEYRGYGIGLKLCDLALECAGGDNTALNCAAKMTGFYEKFGFFHYTGKFKIQARVDTAQIFLDKSFKCSGVIVKDLKDVDWDKVALYDAEISERKREKYLRLWLMDGCADTKIAVDETSGVVVGFACARRQIQNRLVIGPFYANNSNIAKALTNGLLDREDLLSFDQVWFRYPETNTDAIGVIDSIAKGDYVKVRRSMSHYNQRIVENADAAGKVFSVMEGSHSLF